MAERKGEARGFSCSWSTVSRPKNSGELKDNQSRLLYHSNHIKTFPSHPSTSSFPSISMTAVHFARLWIKSFSFFLLLSLVSRFCSFFFVEHEALAAFLFFFLQFL